jgi:hypothetical protein
LVQAGGHGSEAAGPVVRDVVKAYYDKKNKKSDGTVTAENTENKRRVPGAATPAATIQPVVRKEPVVATSAPQSEEPR